MEGFEEAVEGGAVVGGGEAEEALEDEGSDEVARLPQPVRDCFAHRIIPLVRRQSSSESTAAPQARPLFLQYGSSTVEPCRKVRKTQPLQCVSGRTALGVEPSGRVELLQHDFQIRG